MYRSHNIGADSIGRSRSCNTKICHLDLAVCGNNDILGFYITMNNSVTVSRFQSHRNLNGNTGSLFHRKLSFLGDVLLQRNSLNQFHNNVVNSFIVSYIKYVDNIRMGKSCSCLSFTSELPDKCRILTKFCLQNLHCHKSVQFMILGFVNIGHSAGTYFR